MPPLVTFARSLALTFARLTPEERSAKIQAYLLAGVPGRGSVALTDEARTVLRNFEQLSAGVPGAALIPKKELPRCREQSEAPQGEAARKRRSRSMLKVWRRSNKSKRD
jgi:hypothetical protein